MSAVAEATSSVSAPEVVEIETLLAPVAGDNPAGENLQYSGLHDEIREARRAEDDLDQGEWKREPKVADWPKVTELAVSALSTRTKDLQVCAWLSEALVKQYGFAGLRDGLRLMRGLHERFWDRLYPEIDEGDLEGRANALSWMDRQLAVPVKEVPLTRSSDGINYSYLEWEESTQFDFPENLDALEADAHARATELKARAEAEGRVTGEEWRRAKNATRRAFYEETYALINECWAEYQALDHVMDEKFGRETPGLSALRKSLDDVRTLVEKLVKEKRILEPDPVEAAEGSSAAESVEAVGGVEVAGGGSTGPIRTRQEALRRLGEVAAYFQKTEPHSPVSYLVQRAIKWGQMPLEGWLQDVIKDGNVLSQLRETLGLDTTLDGNSSYTDQSAE
ncbi:MAG TPA: type VI secretion system protein TssA [Pyrinomonadaceae bacterium]|nr:type VI secretion system protein TssA [Pyrinomonadaceae bacterium]